MLKFVLLSYNFLSAIHRVTQWVIPSCWDSKTIDCFQYVKLLFLHTLIQNFCFWLITTWCFVIKTMEWLFYNRWQAHDKWHVLGGEVYLWICSLFYPLQLRHNRCDGVSSHQHRDCLLNRLFRRRSKKTSKLRVAGLCAGNSPVTGEFPAQVASNAENISICRSSWLLVPMCFYFQIGLYLKQLSNLNELQHSIQSCNRNLVHPLYYLIGVGSASMDNN